MISFGDHDVRLFDTVTELRKKLHCLNRQQFASGSVFLIETCGDINDDERRISGKS